MNYISRKRYFMLVILSFTGFFNEFFNVGLIRNIDNYTAHVIAFIVSIVFLVIPFIIVEATIHRNYKGEVPKIYKNAEHRWEYFGWLKIISTVVVGFYTLATGSMIFNKLIQYVGRVESDYNLKTGNYYLDTKYIDDIKSVYFGQGFYLQLFIVFFILWILIMFALKKYSDKIIYNFGIILFFVFCSLMIVHLFMKFLVFDIQFDYSIKLLENLRLLFSKDGINIWFFNVKSAFILTSIGYSVFSFTNRESVNESSIVKEAFFIIIVFIIGKLYINMLFIDTIKFFIFRGYNVYTLEPGQMFILLFNLITTNRLLSDVLVVIIICTILLSKCMIALIIFKTFINAIIDKSNKDKNDIINKFVKTGIIICWMLSSVVGYHVIIPIFINYTINYLILACILVEMMYVGKFFIKAGDFDKVIVNVKIRTGFFVLVSYIIPFILAATILNMAIVNVETLKTYSDAVCITEVIIGTLTVFILFGVSYYFYKMIWYKNYKA